MNADVFIFQVPLPDKGAVQKKLLEPQNENSIKRQIKSRGVLTPIGNVRKPNLISVKTGKTNKSSLPATASEALNSLPQSLALKRKSNRKCVTFFDHQRRVSQLYPISRIVPQKKLPLNLYQQQRNLSRWETWTAEYPNVSTSCTCNGSVYNTMFYLLTFLREGFQKHLSFMLSEGPTLIFCRSCCCLLDLR